MITTLRRMVTCRWSARRIGRYLDNDPSAPLPPAQKRRLEEHLAICQRCADVTAEHRALNRALARWSRQRLPDAATTARMHEALERITREGGQ
jgi:anti-sigma factor RsiW